MEGLVYKNIYRYSCDGFSVHRDSFPKEHHLRIRFEQETIADLSCSPLHLEVLAVGHLFALGRITSDMLIHVSLSPGSETTQANVTVQRGSRFMEGIIPVQAIQPEQIISHMAHLAGASPIFTRTGAAHCSGYFEGMKPIFLFEDIARHNTVDRVIGASLLKGINLSSGILCTTGRVSLEIVDRCKRAGVSVLVSRGAPTHRAVELAHLSGMTLLGFARGNRFNVYTHFHRMTDCKAVE